MVEVVKIYENSAQAFIYMYLRMQYFYESRAVIGL